MNNILDIGKDIKSFDGKENVRKVLDYYGNPQDKVKTIHVAGTNGKGSICGFINNILIENSYKVGLYTSPQIIDKKDRFKINNVNISEERLTEYYNDIILVASKLNIIIQQFDIATIISFRYFYDESCDFAIIEVGVGGRIDSTNIIKEPTISIIGKIGKDHMNILGNNIEDIVREKAGIIKDNCPVIIYNQDSKIMNILVEIAKATNSNYIIPNFDKISINKMDINGISFNYLGNEYIIHMTNEIQIYNATIALEVVSYLRKQGFKLNIDKVKIGLEKSKVEGRFQKVNENPLVILDGAHNVDSVKALNETLKKYFPKEKFVFIVTFYKDKEYMKLIEIIAPLSYAFIACETDEARSVKRVELVNLLGIFCDRVHKGVNIKNSLDIATNNYKDKKIIVFGSLSMIKDTLYYFSNGGKSGRL